MSVMTLFRKNNQSQALITTPSADLIRSDNELVLPEPYVPECMEPEKFKKYKELIGDQFDNVSFTKEVVCQILVKLGILIYPMEKIFELLSKQLKYHLNLKVGATEVRWRPTTGDCKYERPIPLRTIKLMKQLQTESGNLYFKGNCDPYGRFMISDISKQYGHRIIFDNNKSLICFLAIELFATSGTTPGRYDSLYWFIIDAWRGPTFSDEEARLS